MIREDLGTFTCIHAQGRIKLAWGSEATSIAGGGKYGTAAEGGDDTVVILSISKTHHQLTHPVTVTRGALQ